MKRTKVMALALTAIMACAALGIGGTLAYLTDTDDTIHNTFTVGNVGITTVEEFDPPTEPPVPNEQYPKIVSVENTGETDAIVFAKVEVPMENVTLVNPDGTKGTKGLQDAVYLQQKDDAITTLKSHLGENWELISESIDKTSKKHTYIYGYKKVLAEGQTAENLFEQFQIKNVMENEMDPKTTYSIDITTYAIQAANIINADKTVNVGDGLDKAELTYAYSVIMNQSK